MELASTGRLFVSWSGSIFCFWKDSKRPNQSRAELVKASGPPPPRDLHKVNTVPAGHTRLLPPSPFFPILIHTPSPPLQETEQEKYAQKTCRKEATKAQKLVILVVG